MYRKVILGALTAMLGLASGWATVPSGYYSSCEGKQGGRTLLKALYNVISDHNTVSYDGLWGVYATSDVDEDGRIIDMYSTKRWPTGSQHCGNYKNVGDCYNREHSFPKSWFNEASPMKSDAFHVVPTDGKVNGQRSNFPYGECSGGTNLGTYDGVTALGRLGTCTYPGYTGKVFEPDDEYKGDFARIYFYMATCYNNKISSWDSPMLAGNDFPCYTTWAVSMLLKWHEQDPVSEKELSRNDAVYAYQDNRNPFVDYPELAQYIWGDKQNQTWTPGATVDPDPTPDPDPEPDPDPTPTPDPDPVGPTEGEGSLSSPLTVAQVLSGDFNNKSGLWVGGYIVGCWTGTEQLQTSAFTMNTNIALADTPDETDGSNTIPVQLKSKTDPFNDLNLKSNPGNLGKMVYVYGDLEKYFSRYGMKDTSAYSWEKESSITEVNAEQPVEVKAVRGGLEVATGSEWVRISIVSADGFVWFSGVVADTERFELPRGIYLVKSPGDLHRVLVK